MALEHAILVALSERDGSGYELARRFDRSIGYFWPATHQQIYRVLRRMDEAGWVTHTEIAQDGRPDKKVYRVSAAGRDELSRWLAEPEDPAVLRDGLGVKLRGASLGDPGVVLQESSGIGPSMRRGSRCTAGSSAGTSRSRPSCTTGICTSTSCSAAGSGPRSRSWTGATK